MTPSDPRRDYYRILQVDQAAHPEIIRAAYRTLLRVLGRHPDLGGNHDDATMLNEAYATLSDSDRRSAYDLWLATHANAPAPAPAPGPSSSIVQWIRGVLRDYRAAPYAPFAHSFDYVLQGSGSFTPRVYVKHFPRVSDAQWPTMVMLCRAIAVARRGFVPSTDVVLFIAETVERGAAFLTEVARHRSGWSWNRWHVALCSADPPRLHVDVSVRLPAALRRLREAASRGVA
jgi:hypothetical protein